jgi:hypothetical protein
VVAAVCLLRRGIACWAWTRVKLEILERSLFLFADFLLITPWCAANKLSVPRLVTLAAEGEAAIFADGQEISLVESVLVFLLLSPGIRIASCFLFLLFTGFSIGSLGKVQTLWLLVAF